MKLKTWHICYMSTAMCKFNSLWFDVKSLMYIFLHALDVHLRGNS